MRTFSADPTPGSLLASSHAMAGIVSPGLSFQKGAGMMADLNLREGTTPELRAKTVEALAQAHTSLVTKHGPEGTDKLLRERMTAPATPTQTAMPTSLAQDPTLNRPPSVDRGNERGVEDREV